MPKKVTMKNLEEVEAPPQGVEEVEEADEVHIEKPKAKSMVPPEKVKEKRPRTEAQRAQFEKAIRAKKVNEEARRMKRQQEEAEAKEALQELIVQKAIKLKKKQLKKAKVIEEVIPDDDTESDSEEEPPVPMRAPPRQKNPATIPSRPAKVSKDIPPPIPQPKYRFL